MIAAIYRTADGEIVSVAHGVTPRDVPGCGTIDIESSLIDPNVHKVDPVTLTVVEKTAAEIARANMPTMGELQSAIVRELHATDAFMMPDRPLSDDARKTWVDYRKSLRDLSNLPIAAADLIAAFPKRPDGADAIAALRSRLLC